MTERPNVPGNHAVAHVAIRGGGTGMNPMGVPVSSTAMIGVASAQLQVPVSTIGLQNPNHAYQQNHVQQPSLGGGLVPAAAQMPAQMPAVSMPQQMLVPTSMPQQQQQQHQQVAMPPSLPTSSHALPAGQQPGHGQMMHAHIAVSQAPARTYQNAHAQHVMTPQGSYQGQQILQPNLSPIPMSMPMPPNTTNTAMVLPQEQAARTSLPLPPSTAFAMSRLPTTTSAAVPMPPPTTTSNPALLPPPLLTTTTLDYTSMHLNVGGAAMELSHEDKMNKLKSNRTMWLKLRRTNDYWAMYDNLNPDDNPREKDRMYQLACVLCRLGRYNVRSSQGFSNLRRHAHKYHMKELEELQKMEGVEGGGKRPPGSRRSRPPGSSPPKRKKVAAMPTALPTVPPGSGMIIASFGKASEIKATEQEIRDAILYVKGMCGDTVYYLVVDLLRPLPSNSTKGIAVRDAAKLYLGAGAKLDPTIGATLNSMANATEDGGDAAEKDDDDDNNNNGEPKEPPAAVISKEITRDKDWRAFLVHVFGMHDAQSLFWAADEFQRRRNGLYEAYAQYAQYHSSAHMMAPASAPAVGAVP